MIMLILTLSHAGIRTLINGVKKTTYFRLQAHMQRGNTGGASHKNMGHSVQPEQPKFVGHATL